MDAQPALRTSDEDVPLARVVRPATLLCLLVLGVSLVSLLPHVSRDAVVLGRYSWSYSGFIAGYLALGAALVGLLFAPDTVWSGARAWTRQWSSRVRMLCWWAMVLTVLVALAAALAVMQRWEPGRSLMGQIGLLAVAVWFAAVATGILGSRGLLERFGNGILLCAATGMTLAMCETALRLWPQLIPEPVMQWLPGGGRYLHRADFVEDHPLRVGYRFAPLQDRWIRFDSFDPGIARVVGTTGPYSPDPTAPLSLRFVTDEDGFLNAPPVRDRQFDVVIAGDSFMGPTAEVLWTDLLRDLTGLSVLNLGNSGWGTQAEVEALEIYGVPKTPRWAILAFFGGNDLWDVVRYEQKKESGLSWIEHDEAVAGFWRLLVTPRLFFYYWYLLANKVRPPDFLYPMDVRVADRALRLELTQQYVGVLGASAEDIERSRNYALVKESILRAREVSAAAGARFLWVYIPSEPQIYLPHVPDAELARIAARAPSIELGGDGNLQFASRPPSPAALLRHADDQASVLASFARKHGIEFVDLTAAFKREAGQGNALYNYADTHWNAAGQTLAAEIVAAHIGHVSQ